MSEHGAAGATGFARAAFLIAALTVLARVAGFGRILVFSRTVGTNCLGDTYQAINAVPNIVFEVVAGGALAGAVVPLLAHAVERDDRAAVNRTASALLCWAMLLLGAVAVVVAVFAQPIAGYLLAAKPCGAGATAVGARMLRVFAPQIPLYGLGIVLTGVLHAHRRFAGPAVAPLLSSTVVIASYLAFAAVAGFGAGLPGLGRSGELVLSIGTTLGVAALSGGLLVPLAATPVRLRPALRFPAGVAARAIRLAGAGLFVLLAQQAAVLVTLKLGNGAGVPAGEYAGFTYAQTVSLVPWAVLAVPIATAVFPRLSAAYDSADDAAYATEVAAAIRAVLLMSLLGTALLAAAGRPIAGVVVESAAPGGATAHVAAAIAALAPGVVGYGLFALLSRALYAAGRPRSVTLAAVAGWSAVIVADLVLATALPAGDRLLALGIGGSVGMTVLGAGLLLAVRRHAGRGAFAGVRRAGCGGLLAASVAAAAGWALAAPLAGGPMRSAGAGILVVAVVLVVFGAVAAGVAGPDVRELLRGIRRRRG